MRKSVGREAEPSLTVIDSQSVKLGQKGGSEIGVDGVPSISNPLHRYIKYYITRNASLRLTDKTIAPQSFTHVSARDLLAIFKA